MTIATRKGSLSDLALEYGLKTKEQLLSYVRSVPYGRSSNRGDFSLVFSENRGTCSTKHALIKSIAIEQQWTDTELVLVMYKMNKENTPGIGNVLAEAGVLYVPEAHCVLKMGAEVMDITSSDSDYDRLEGSILMEKSIKPEQVGQWKVDFHRDYMKNWILKASCGYDFDEIWALREKCILRLSENENKSI